MSWIFTIAKGVFTISILEKMNKQIGSPEYEEKIIDSISFVLVVMTVAILPLIAIPKEVATPIYIWYFLDFIGYYKVIFLLMISMLMISILGFKAIARKQRIKFSLPLVLFIIWVFVSFIFSMNKVVAFVGYTLRWQGLLSYLCYFTIFTFVVNMLKPKYIGKVLAAFFASASIIAIHSIINYYGFEPLEISLMHLFGYKDVVIDTRVSRAALGNRNTAGAYFTLLTIISLIMFLKNGIKKRNVIYFFVLLLSYAGLLVSLTRVAWLGVICAVVFIGWTLRKDIKKYFSKIILVVVAFALVLFMLDITGDSQITGRYYSFQDQLRKARDGDLEQFGSTRFYIYGRALKVIADNPIVGVGPDCFAFVGSITEEDFEKHPELGGTGYFDKVHSEYLEFAVTMGIPALIFWLWFILSIYVPWLRKKNEIRPEMLAIFFAWTGYLIQATFNFGAISVLPEVFVLIGILKIGLIYENNEGIDQGAKNGENINDKTCIELVKDDIDDNFSLT